MLKRLFNSTLNYTKKRSSFIRNTTKRLISFNSQNYSKFHNLTSDEIIKNFTEISSIPTQDRTAQLKEKLIILNHTREQIAIEAPQNPNYFESVENLRQLTFDLQSQITEEEINSLNSEELYCLMAGFVEPGNTQLGNLCLNRFYDLIKEDLKDQTYQTTMRVMECHIFSRIIGVIGFSKEPFISSDSFADFEVYVDSFVKRHSQNFGFFDKALVMALVSDIANPISGKKKNKK